jgi:Xaa-Pro aminopeptidase
MSEMRIPRSEYEGRWRRAQDEARARALDGLVVFSRGGGPVDSMADVFYLSNHYGPFVWSNDLPRWWVGRAHAAVVLPTDGEPTLVVDVSDWRRDLVVVEDVRMAFNVPATVAQVVEEKGLSRGSLGLVVGNGMMAGPYRHLLEVLGDARLEHVDGLIEEIRMVKSENELTLLRESAAVGNRVVQAIMEAALEPGTTEAEAVAAGVDIAVKAPVAVYDVAVASGPNSNWYAYGRLPSWTTRTLEAGDFFHIDTYGMWEGYLYDFTRTTVVGGGPTPEQREVVDAAIDAIDAGLAVMRPGVKAREVYATVRGVLEEREMTGEGLEGDIATTPALTGSFPAHGHGIGLFWDPPWLVPDEELELQAGMAFGVETMAGRPGLGSVKFEQDVIVTDSGTELLTTIPKVFW